MSLLEKLKAGIRNNRDVEFYNQNVVMRVLSEAEMQGCRTAAIDHATQKKLDQDSLMIEMVIRQLFLSLSDADGKPIADSLESFKGLLNREEREYFASKYLELEKECSPSFRAMTDEEYKKLEAEVKKDPFFLLSGSNIDSLKKLILYLENQPSI